MQSKNKDTNVVKITFGGFGHSNYTIKTIVSPYIQELYEEATNEDRDIMVIYFAQEMMSRLLDAITSTPQLPLDCGELEQRMGAVLQNNKILTQELRKLQEKRQAIYNSVVKPYNLRLEQKLKNKSKNKTKKFGDVKLGQLIYCYSPEGELMAREIYAIAHDCFYVQFIYTSGEIKESKLSFESYGEKWFTII